MISRNGNWNTASKISMVLKISLRKNFKESWIKWKLKTISSSSILRLIACKRWITSVMRSAKLITFVQLLNRIMANLKFASKMKVLQLLKIRISQRQKIPNQQLKIRIYQQLKIRIFQRQKFPNQQLKIRISQRRQTPNQLLKIRILLLRQMEAQDLYLTFLHFFSWYHFLCKIQ